MALAGRTLRDLAPAHWLNLALALFGPAVVAMIGHAAGGGAPSLGLHLAGVGAIAAIVVAVYAIAMRREGYSLAQLGFGALSWRTPLLGLALAAFFIFAFGPFAYWLLATLGLGGFDAGLATAQRLPPLVLAATILVVATAEELLYRGYAIARLTDLTGSRAVAGVASTLAFGLAHAPMWGWGPALTTALAGGVMTIVYLWRRDVAALAIAHVCADLYGLAPVS